MARFYTTSQLSGRIAETPEGFLVCEAVPIARAGTLAYKPGETPITPGDGDTIITRNAADIQSPETIASFEGKPVTLQHPADFVTPETWKELAVGVVQNVRAGTGDDADKLLADLLITDAAAIDAVKSKRLREVSCGYEAEYIEDAPGLGRQTTIRGNHVAIVTQGRCGSECAIFDAAPTATKEIKRMTMREKLKGLLGKAVDEAMPDETQPVEEKPVDIGDMLAALIARVDALEAAMKPADAAPEETAPEAANGEEKPADEPTPEQDAEPEATQEVDRLSRIEAILEKLASALILDAKDGEDAKPECDAETCDADTVARAEILAPGVPHEGDADKVRADALTHAYGTADGKAAIDALLAGRAFDAKDVTVFNAAAEVLRVQRNAAQTVRPTADAKREVMTPEKLNAYHAQLFPRSK